MSSFYYAKAETMQSTASHHFGILSFSPNCDKFPDVSTSGTHTSEYWGSSYLVFKKEEEKNQSGKSPAQREQENLLGKVVSEVWACSCYTQP